MWPRHRPPHRSVARPPPFRAGLATRGPACNQGRWYSRQGGPPMPIEKTGVRASPRPLSQPGRLGSARRNPSARICDCHPHHHLWDLPGCLDLLDSAAGLDSIRGTTSSRTVLSPVARVYRTIGPDEIALHRARSGGGGTRDPPRTRPPRHKDQNPAPASSLFRAAAAEVPMRCWKHSRRRADASAASARSLRYDPAIVAPPLMCPPPDLMNDPEFRPA